MIKAAIIGAGTIARQHLGCLKSLKNVRIAAVCDLSPAAAESAAERFDVPEWFTDHNQMLQQIRPDVAHVTTPVTTHYALAADALDYGCHTIVEKPITTSLEQLGQLCERAHRANRVLVEDHNYLFNRTIQKIVQLLASGQMGPVVHVEAAICLDLTAPGSPFTDPNLAHPSVALAGGAVGDFLTHLCYFVPAFLGPHRRVRTVWTNHHAGSSLPYDHMDALVETERGTAALSFHGHVQPEAFWVRVTTDRMRAEAHLFEPRLTVERLHSGPRPLTPLLNGFDIARSAAGGAVAGLWRKLSPGPGSYEGLWELLRRTYAAIDTGGNAPVSIEQIREVNRLVHDLARGAGDLSDASSDTTDEHLHRGLHRTATVKTATAAAAPHSAVRGQVGA